VTHDGGFSVRLLGDKHELEVTDDPIDDTILRTAENYRAFRGNNRSTLPPFGPGNIE